MGRRVISGLKTRVRRKCSISRRRARLYSEGIHVREFLGESRSVTSGGGGAAPGVRTAKSSEFGDGKS